MRQGKKTDKPQILILVLTLVGAAAGIAYHFTTKQVYETVASVVLYRDRIETPGASSEETKNRWVWVRDGLTLTESLLSDDALEAMVSQRPELQKRYDDYKTRQLKRHQLERPDDEMPVFLHRIRNEIKIDYTGGDSNTFIFTVKDRSPQIAQYLAQSIVERLKHVWIDQLHENYTDALAAIAAEAGKAGPENSSLVSRNYLRTTYNGLLVESRLSQVMAEKNFQIVRKPSFPVAPIWPNLTLVTLLGAAIGLLIGLFVTFLKAVQKE